MMYKIKPFTYNQLRVIIDKYVPCAKINVLEDLLNNTCDTKHIYIHVDDVKILIAKLKAGESVKR